MSHTPVSEAQVDQSGGNRKRRGLIEQLPRDLATDPPSVAPLFEGPPTANSSGRAECVEGGEEL